jgi:hypothetical protein
LVNAGKYTSDIQYLGYFQLFIGSVSLFFLGYGLVFGPLVLEFHIVYGTIMFKKTDNHGIDKLNKDFESRTD